MAYAEDSLSMEDLLAVWRSIRGQMIFTHTHALDAVGIISPRPPQVTQCQAHTPQIIRPCPWMILCALQFMSDWLHMWFVPVCPSNHNAAYTHDRSNVKRCFTAIWFGWAAFNRGSTPAAPALPASPLMLSACSATQWPSRVAHHLRDSIESCHVLKPDHHTYSSIIAVPSQMQRSPLSQFRFFAWGLKRSKRKQCFGFFFLTYKYRVRVWTIRPAVLREGQMKTLYLNRNV